MRGGGMEIFMKKCISVWSFKENSCEEIFKLANEAGFDGVELALGSEGLITMNTTKEDIDDIKNTAKKYNIGLYSLACGLYWEYSLTSDDAAQREKAKAVLDKQLDIASWMGVDTILVVPGAVSVGFAPDLGVVDYETAYNRALDALRQAAPKAENLGVFIGIENVWNNFLLSPIEMRDFIDKTGSEFVGAYFDVGNVLKSGYPEHWIRALGKKIKKVHFKDFRMNGLQFVDLLAGDVDYEEVMKALHEIGYDSSVTAEMGAYKTHNEVMIYNTSRAMDKILGR
jgi:L-ribulose-5-phosphate 3-epimerase